eukprot:TRINITY_DN3051_c0_g1_i2.p2 TRINITY_DN3051_c0_g1~~TRINITY_DN3051_c0_g1_i2.p2  ORF type:complete len:186 (-),score=62.68 TRINITY_DN3051_c0_g1_i2:116-673(-)
MDKDKNDEEAKAPHRPKEDPFGGLKPRDETEYEKHKLQRKGDLDSAKDIPLTRKKETVVESEEEKVKPEEDKKEDHDMAEEGNEEVAEYERRDYHGEQHNYYHEPRFRRRGRGYHRGSSQRGRYRESRRTWHNYGREEEHPRTHYVAKESKPEADYDAERNSMPERKNRQTTNAASRNRFKDFGD